MVQPRRKGAGLEGRVEERPSSRAEQPTGNLQGAFERFGFTVSKAKREYGIDPAVVLRSREKPDGTRVYLCCEETKDGQRVFYTLTATKPTEDWREIIEKYKSE